jgi:hypothetical protein
MAKDSKGGVRVAGEDVADVGVEDVEQASVHEGWEHIKPFVMILSGGVIVGIDKEDYEVAKRFAEGTRNDIGFHPFAGLGGATISMRHIIAAMPTALLMRSGDYIDLIGKDVPEHLENFMAEQMGPQVGPSKEELELARRNEAKSEYMSDAVSRMNETVKRHHPNT